MAARECHRHTIYVEMFPHLKPWIFGLNRLWSMVCYKSMAGYHSNLVSTNVLQSLLSNHSRILYEHLRLSGDNKVPPYLLTFFLTPDFQRLFYRSLSDSHCWSGPIKGISVHFLGKESTFSLPCPGEPSVVLHCFLSNV